MQPVRVLVMLRKGTSQSCATRVQAWQWPASSRLFIGFPLTVGRVGQGVRRGTTARSTTREGMVSTSTWTTRRLGRCLKWCSRIRGTTKSKIGFLTGTVRKTGNFDTWGDSLRNFKNKLRILGGGGELESLMERSCFTYP